jgi:hypothetical protein
MVDEIQRTHDEGGGNPTDIYVMMDGIQVKEVTAASQSTPNSVWI